MSLCLAFSIRLRTPLITAASLANPWSLESDYDPTGLLFISFLIRPPIEDDAAGVSYP